MPKPANVQAIFQMLLGEVWYRGDSKWRDVHAVEQNARASKKKESVEYCMFSR